MNPYIIVGLILYGGVIGSLLGISALLVYMLIESRSSRSKGSGGLQ